MATPEMFGALLHQLADLAAAMRAGTGQQPQATAGQNRKLIDTRYLKLPSFGGEIGNFDDWSFTFKRMIRSVSRQAYDLLCQAETINGSEWDSFDLDMAEVDMDAYSAEIFDLLCHCCSGEALAVIRSVDDMDGMKAWFKMYKKYQPKTMARAIRLVGQVTNPPKIADIKDTEAGLDKWEEHIKVLAKDFGERFSDTVKVGIVTSILPPSVRELVYQSIGDTVVYEDTVQRIRAVVSNKVAMMAGPCPMDVGRVDCEHGQHGGLEDSGCDDVGAVSMQTQCHGCWGWGHMKRECPTAKGGKGVHKGMGKGGQGGKGGFGKGGGKGDKGGQKGNWQQQSWQQQGDKGGQKGTWRYQGDCWKCGKKGHKAAECHTRMANAVEEAGEQEAAAAAVDMGGVWVIGAVEAIGGHRIKTRNRFQALTEESEDDIEDEVNVMGVDPAQARTRMSAMEFNVAEVKKPLASAAKVVKAKNRIVLDEEGSYVENKVTGERMEVKMENETFVFEVEFDDGEFGKITLDSGAGASVWPEKEREQVPMMPRNPGLRMCAANGTEIKNFGRKIMKFRGIKVDDVESDFRRRV